MTAIGLADGLRERDVSFNLFRTALRQNELAASQGWEKTLDKLVEQLGNDKCARAYEAGLKDIYTDLTLFGNKVVKIFALPEQVEDLAASMDYGFINEESVYKKAFPMPLEQEALAAAPLDIDCVAKWNSAEGPAFILCSKQYVVEREALPSGALNDETVDEFGQFDEVYGVRKKAVQLFDVVAFNFARGTVEIRMDGLAQQRLSDVEKRLKFVQTLLNQHAEANLGVSQLLPTPINFYPCIKKLYESSDGRIGEIGHSTESAGIHRGKMRRRADDFRDDKYHAGGVKGVSELNAHMLAKRWDSPTRHGIVELLIPGTLSIASLANPVIDIALILSCASEDDYNFVTTKLFDSLKT